MLHRHVSPRSGTVEARLLNGVLLDSELPAEAATEHIVVQRLTLPHPTVVQTYATWIAEQAESWGSRAVSCACPRGEEITLAEAVANIAKVLEAVLELELSESDAERRMVILITWSQLFYGGEAGCVFVRQFKRPERTPALIEFRSMVSALLVAVRWHAGA